MASTAPTGPPRTQICLEKHAWYEALPAAPAVVAGDLLFIGGQAAVDETGAVMSPGDVEAQTREVLETIRQILDRAGGTLADVVDVVSFHADPRQIPQALNVAGDFFASDPPAWTPVGFVGGQHPGTLVVVRAIAHLGEGPKRCVLPESQAWLREYPVSAACVKGGLVFIAGQSAAHADGTFEQPLDHRRQARLAYAHMLEVLALAGGTVDDILDFSSFHHDIRGAIPTLEDVYIPDVIGADRHADRSPSTSHIGSTGLLRPEMLGVYGAVADLTPGERVGSTPDAIWWKGKYPIAGAARKSTGNLVTVAGQVASAPDGSILHAGDIEAQARFIFEEMRETLEGFGLSMRDVVEVSSFHKDARSWETVMQVAADFFATDAAPAWTFVASPGLWFEGYHHEISALAVSR
jgi:enamine deaminase RidA (YjgF/YER057c/UK114 family)